MSVAACGFTAWVSRHSVSFTKCLPRHTVSPILHFTEVVNTTVKLSFGALLGNLDEAELSQRLDGVDNGMSANPCPSGNVVDRRPAMHGCQVDVLKHHQRNQPFVGFEWQVRFGKYLG